MHLLNVHTFKLASFDLRNVPKYAILSHTWGEEEVTYKDITKRPADRTKSGWKKILGMIEIAKEGLDWIWVDTCCIDKSSSAELSEDINSMFSYYSKAQYCIVYLEDVPPQSSHSKDIKLRPLHYVQLERHTEVWKDVPDEDSTSDAFMEHALSTDFARSRWFTRGWTLQELIAPKIVMFYAQDWTFIGLKDSLSDEIRAITKIDKQVLLKPSYANQRCVAQRMCWASRRVTTRAEDEAYCLMGLFQVNMPLLYGEGGAKAFMRLQQEILKISTDHSLFIWTAESDTKLPKDSRTNGGLLAESPLEFKDCNRLQRYYMKDSVSATEPYDMTNLGLRISLPVIEISGRHIAILNCRPVLRQSRSTSIGLFLRKTSRNDGKGFQRECDQRPIYVKLDSRTDPRIIRFHEANHIALPAQEFATVFDLDRKEVHTRMMYVTQQRYIFHG
jgi:hypothetical protein